MFLIFFSSGPILSFWLLSSRFAYLLIFPLGSFILVEVIVFAIFELSFLLFPLFFLFQLFPLPFDFLHFIPLDFVSLLFLLSLNTTLRFVGDLTVKTLLTLLILVPDLFEGIVSEILSVVRLPSTSASSSASPLVPFISFVGVLSSMPVMVSSLSVKVVMF